MNNRNDGQKDHPSYNRNYTARPYYRRRPYDYNNNRFNNNGFKVPRRISNRLRRKRHLKSLRKTACDLAGADKPSLFVYKEGMISLLRPPTPYNSTEFLIKQRRDSKNDEIISPSQMMKGNIFNFNERKYMTEVD